MEADTPNGTVIIREPFGLRARRTLRRIRRMPILAVTVLTIMVICAITANWISLHDPINGDLSDRILPPIWEGPKFVTQTVVDEVAIGQRFRQVAIGSEDFEEARALEEARAAKEGQLVRSIAIGDTLDVRIRDAGSAKFPLGTDHLGRDILSRLFHGARISLIVALITLGVGGTIGTFVGLLSGYYGGWVDELLMRIVDVFLSLPYLLVALVLVVVIRPVLRTHCGDPLNLYMAPLRAGGTSRGSPTREYGLHRLGPSVRGRHLAYIIRSPFSGESSIP